MNIYSLYTARWIGTGLLALALIYSVPAQPAQPTLSQPIPNQFLNQGAAEVDLRNHFGLPGVTGQVVQFVTNLGRINVELHTAEAPRHVANFLSYVSSKEYDNSLIHRIDTLGAQVPAIVQGGRLLVGPFTPTPPAISKGDPVPLEYRLPNVRGTLAAARSSDALIGHANEWFFNTIDNSATLGPAAQGGYTVFGRVLGGGMTVVDAIAQVPTFDLKADGLDRFPLRNFSSTQTQLTPANLVVVSAVRVVPIYPAVQGDPTAVLSFTASSSAPSIVSAQVVGATLKLTPLTPGTANVTVQARDANNLTSAPSTFSVQVPSNALLPPIFVSQPASLSAPAGSTVAFNAAASGANPFFPIKYQWFFNGNPLRGPDSAYLILRGITTDHAGTYHCVATNAMGSTSSSTAVLSIAPGAASDEGRFVNLAIHTLAGTEDEPLIVGFIVGGKGTSGAQPLLMRAMGPSLAQFGVGNVVSDPAIALYRNQLLLAENDDWNGDAQVALRTREVGAFGFASPASLDAACAYSLAPAAYTIHVFGKTEETGLSLAEIYDGTLNSGRTFSRLVNISARAALTTETDRLVAGFVVRGSTPLTVLIRAIGPGLGALGVADTVADPKLQLYQGSFLVRTNDNWGGDAQLEAVATAVGAFRLPDPASRDAALLLTLQPGSYTAQVSSADLTGGVALIEVYEYR